MIKRGFVSLIVLSLTVISCATVDNSEWGPIDDHSRAKISLNLEGKALNRESASTIKSRIAWGESGVWKNRYVDNEIQAWIYVYKLSDKVFTNESSVELESTIRNISGDGYIAFDEKDQIKTKYGPVNYQYYSVSGLNCFFIESFWADSYVAYFDTVRNASSGEHIIGNNLIRAFYCENDQSRLQLEDIEDFLRGIHVRDIYWPDGIFTENKGLL